MAHEKIIKRLCDLGYPTYLVGGAIRDLLGGEIPHDYDIVTKATPEAINDIFNDQVDKTRGKKFAVTYVGGIEVATFRTDSYPDEPGAKNCVTKYASTIEEDISRRDFTVNAIAMCPYSGDIIDNFSGVHDLKNGIIRFVGNPGERIREDPNRIIRGCRFVAKLEGSFDPETLQALRERVHLVRLIDKERLRGEIMKAMELRRPSLFFNALNLIGALDLIFPGLLEWDPAGDLISPEFPLVRLAVYLHDCGKPLVFCPVEKTHVSLGNVSGKLVENWLKTLKFSVNEIKTVVSLVKTHGLEPGNNPREIRKFRKKLFDSGVCESDWLNAHFTKLDHLEDMLFRVTDLAISGGDIIRVFNISPGKVIGMAQQHLLNFVIEEGPDKNNLDELVSECRRFLNDNN